MTTALGQLGHTQHAPSISTPDTYVPSTLRRGSRPVELEVSLPLFSDAETSSLARHLTLTDDKFYTFAVMHQKDCDFMTTRRHLFLLIVKPKEGTVEGIIDPSSESQIIRGTSLPTSDLIALHSRMQQGARTFGKKEFKSAVLNLLEIAGPKFRALGTHDRDPENSPATVMGDDIERIAKDLREGHLRRALLRVEK